MVTETKETNTPAEIKKIIKSGNTIIGTETTIKELKRGKISLVYTTSNCPSKIKTEIQRYAKIAGVNVEELIFSNEELGVICKKPFLISVLGVLK